MSQVTQVAALHHPRLQEDRMVLERADPLMGVFWELGKSQPGLVNIKCSG